MPRSTIAASGLATTSGRSGHVGVAIVTLSSVDSATEAWKPSLPSAAQARSAAERMPFRAREAGRLGEIGAERDAGSR